MKKKILSVLLVLMLLLCTTAMGAGKLKITDMNLILYSGKDSGYFYAKVENVGDAPVGVGSGDLVLFTEDDNILLTESYVTTTPYYAVLQPGEYLYIKEYLWDDALKTTPVGEYKFSIPVRDRASEMTQVSWEAEYEPSGEKYDNYIYVTFTNETDTPRYNFYVTAALYDEEGELIYVDSKTLYDTAVHPGSTVTVQFYVDSSMIEEYWANDIVPTSIDAIVCFLND